MRNHNIQSTVRRLAGCWLAGCWLTALCLVAAGALSAENSSTGVEIWRFDQTATLGGHTVKVLGHPQVIQTPYGKAVQFSGSNDALFVDVHPLAGAETWTWEVIFRPDQSGAAAQRFFHLSVLNPSTGTDADDRMLFEIRIVNGEWCLDSFALSHGQSKALLNCQKLHPLGQWYRVTAVYDGKTLRNYVGSELQGEGEVQLAPEGPGHSSIGVRINLKDYFTGAVFEARFTRRALQPEDFLAWPPPDAEK